MSNRIIKDLIWTSPRLARCSIEAQLHFPRLVLLSDDWGCFNADVDVIHGLAYPKMKIGNQKIITMLDELENHGLLFRWQNGLHEWGFWTTWDEHQYSSSSAFNETGQRIKHRRKTPEPPGEILKGYINQHYTKNYYFNFTPKLKEEVRTRDENSCQLCGKLQKGRSYSVHHIDHNKTNDDPQNLITLCPSCHRRVHTKNFNLLEQLGTKWDKKEQPGTKGSYLNPNPNLNPNLNPDIVPQIINYLNEKTGKKFSPKSEATVKLISGRLSEGHTLDDFKQVIDTKAAKWRGDPKMDDYLRPDTLFRPSNFESYLNEQPPKPPVGTNIKPSSSREVEYQKARAEFIRVHGDDKDKVAEFSQEWWDKQ